MSSPSTPDRLPPEQHPLMGCTLGGRYRIVQVLDEGGMGTVFVAEQLRLKRQVAVKVIATHLQSSAETLARFAREAEVLSRLQHPHVVNVVDFDVAEGGEPYLVMELLNGETLAQRLEREQRLEPRAVLDIVEQIASGLTAAHAAGVVHRDLKPENVFLVEAPGSRGFVKLLDFGISKQLSVAAHPRITAHHALLGTVQYMAPEQALGEDELVDARTDQYAVGAIAYELLSGRPPFDDENVVRILRQIVVAPLAPIAEALGLPPEVDAVLARALAKSPADRFGDVAELAVALGAALAPVLAGNGSWLPSIMNPDEPRAVGDAAVQSGVRARRERQEDELTLVERLGGLARRMAVSRTPSSRDRDLSPELAYLVSRFDGGLTVGDALELSPLSRGDTLRAFGLLLRDGILAFEAERGSAT